MPTYKVDECSRKMQKRLEEAGEYARKSSMLQKIGTVVEVGGEFFYGYNSIDRNVSDVPSCHAEMDALRKCGKKIGKRSGSYLQDAWPEKEF